ITEIMEELFQRSSLRMGSFEGITPDGIELGKEWQRNDGLVNTISARAPSFAPAEDFPDPASVQSTYPWKTLSTETGTNYISMTEAEESQTSDLAESIVMTDIPPLKKGVWYIMPELTGDHMSLQGGLTIKTDITGLYIKHLDMINRL
nr:hypothetical protein [Treponemataceae bacterium]